MNKSESKNTPGRLFDSILSDDDDFRTSSSYTHSSKSNTHMNNAPEQKLNVKQNSNINDDTSSPKQPLNRHKDLYSSEMLPGLLPLKQSETTTANVSTDFPPPEPVKIEKLVFITDDHMGISTVDALPNQTTDPVSQHSELVSDETLFKGICLDIHSPNVVSSKVLPMPENPSEPPKLKEESNCNLRDSVAHDSNVPVLSPPVENDFHNIQHNVVCGERSIDNLGKLREHRLAPNPALHSLDLLQQRRYEDLALQHSLSQPQNNIERGYSNFGNSIYFSAYIFPRLDASLVNPKTQFTRENPPPNCVELCLGFLLRADPRLMVYFAFLLVSMLLTVISQFTPQIISINDNCYTYWGYKKNCEHTSFTVPVLLIENRSVKNLLFVGGIFSIIALILYLIALIAVWVYIFCIDDPLRDMPKILRWRIGCFGFAAFIFHFVSFILIIGLYAQEFTLKETDDSSLGLGFDLSLVTSLLHSLGLILFIFVPYSKIPFV
ncbi:unnamed protein product [Phytomonas sp. Hart1]|nr:unnamed protein product [Phytomonas sp. Hart1]|eukprot:CCW68679.1 unnamed protein product [Phytomonas sp. isolate Hart1]